MEATFVRALRVASSDTRGRYLVSDAPTPVPAGALLLRAAPLVAVVAATSHCHVCLAEKRVQKCSSCEVRK